MFLRRHGRCNYIHFEDVQKFIETEIDKKPMTLAAQQRLKYDPIENVFVYKDKNNVSYVIDDFMCATPSNDTVFGFDTKLQCAYLEYLCSNPAEGEVGIQQMAELIAVMEGEIGERLRMVEAFGDEISQLKSRIESIRGAGKTDSLEHNKDQLEKTLKCLGCEIKNYRNAFKHMLNYSSNQNAIQNNNSAQEEGAQKE